MRFIMLKLKQSSIALTLALLAVFVPELALAAADLGTIGGDLCTTVVGALTGRIGQAVATAAVVIVGISAFFGKVNWGMAIMVGAGIIGIFGAAAIAGSLGGGC